MAMLHNQRVEISQCSMISVDFPLFRPETREDSALGASHGDDRVKWPPVAITDGTQKWP